MRSKIAKEPRAPEPFNVALAEFVSTTHASSKTRRTKLSDFHRLAPRGSEVIAMAHLTSEFVDNSLFLANHVQEEACSLHRNLVSHKLCSVAVRDFGDCSRHGGL